MSPQNFETLYDYFYFHMNSIWNNLSNDIKKQIIDSSTIMVVQ